MNSEVVNNTLRCYHVFEQAYEWEMEWEIKKISKKCRWNAYVSANVNICGYLELKFIVKNEKNWESKKGHVD